MQDSPPLERSRILKPNPVRVKGRYHANAAVRCDIALAGLGRISLTTVAQPLDFQAKRAVSVLLERIAAPNIAPRQIRVPFELRLRESTAQPAAR